MSIERIPEGSSSKKQVSRFRKVFSEIIIDIFPGSPLAKTLEHLNKEEDTPKSETKKEPENKKPNNDEIYQKFIDKHKQLTELSIKPGSPAYNIAMKAAGFGEFMNERDVVSTKKS